MDNDAVPSSQVAGVEEPERGEEDQGERGHHGAENAQPGNVWRHHCKKNLF